MTNPSPTVPARAQILLPAMVALLVVAGISPIVDVLVSGSLHLGDYQQRFRLIGLVYANLPQLCIVLVLIVTAGLVAASRPVVRGASIAAILIGAIMIVLLPIFGLDFLQARHVVPDTSRTMFVVASMKTVLFAAFLVPVLIWGGRRGVRATPKPAVTGRHQRTKGEGLVVAQDEER